MNSKNKKRFSMWLAAGVIGLALAILFFSYVMPAMKSKFLKAKMPAGETEGHALQPVGGEQEEGEKIAPVVTQKAAASDFQDVLPAMGTIKGIKEIELRFETNGVVDAINFKEADIIKKNDIIAILNQQDMILKLEYAQAKLKSSQTQSLAAKKKLEIHQKLYQVGAIIKSKLEEMALEYENSKSQVVQAEKEAAFAKQEMQKAYLVSPIDGIMGTRDVEAGEFVTSATKTATIIDISSVYAEVGIIERDLQKIALGQEAAVTVDSYPNTTFKGAIENVLPVIEGKSRTITCRIKLDNSSGQLLPGMFARAEIFVFAKEGAFVLPSACLRDKDNDGVFDSLFVISEDNTAHQKDVVVGYLTTDSAVIDEGLQEGEIVVTEARGELIDGSTVEVLEREEAFKPTEQPVEEGEGELEVH